jgi:serine acetyltransferase
MNTQTCENLILTNQDYTIYYDLNRPLCFVGNTKYNNMLYQYWNTRQSCQLLSLEEVVNHGQAWIDQHQFICAVSNINFKYFVVEKLKQFCPHYFSVVGVGNLFANTNIGKGTFIQNYNTATCNNITVGDHCTISSFTHLSHNTTVGNYCHISSYNFINYADLGNGNLLAVRCNILGKPNHTLSIAPNCNFMLGSTVTNPIVNSGTYFGNRQINQNTSLQVKIL